jgi:hypothetical protein
MVEQLGWAVEFCAAPDLAQAGAVIIRQIEGYLKFGPPQARDKLESRLIFESSVRTFIRRCEDRRFPWVRELPELHRLFRDFVTQNTEAEATLLRQMERRAYERGRSEALEAAEQGWSATRAAPPPEASPVPSASRVESLLQTIADRLGPGLPPSSGRKKASSANAAMPKPG